MLIDEFGHKADTDELIGNIVFYGAATRNQKVIDELGISDRVLFFADRDEQKAGKKLGDYRIESVNALSKRDDIIVVSVLVEHMQEVKETVNRLGHSCLFYVLEKFDIEEAVRSNYEILSIPKTYKYIHFFPAEKFLKPFFDMAEAEMNIAEHLFIVDFLKDDKYGVFKYIRQKNALYHNILIFDDVHNILHIAEESINCSRAFEHEKMHEIFLSSQKILLHSAFFGYYMQRYLSQLADVFGSKMAWICWGGDSYYDEDVWVVQNVLKKVKVAYSAQARIEAIKKNYGIEVKGGDGCSYCYIPYNNKSKIHFLDKKYINILLGHSAAEYGNHIEGLKLLYKWKDENIKLHCPLSYGPIDYRDTVISKGREMFGDKFVPMIEFMEMEQYYAFLNDIDVAVLPMTRMAGGTNLVYLSSQGKKIYLNREIIQSYSDMAVHAYDIELIRKQTFAEFIHSDACNVSREDNNISVAALWLKLLND